MSEGFGDVDWSKGSDNPFGIPCGPNGKPALHAVSISSAWIEKSKNDNLGLYVEFSNDEGETIRKWCTLPVGQATADSYGIEADDEKTYKRNTSFLRLLFRNLEIPEEDWTAVVKNPELLVGLDCVITVAPQKDPQYNQVTRIVRAKAHTSEGVVAFQGSNMSVAADGGESFDF